MSSLLERGKDEFGRARQLASERVQSRIPGRRSGASAAVDRTSTRARRATEWAEMLVRRAREWVDGAQQARQRRRKRIAAATVAGAAGGAGAYFLNRARSDEGQSDEAQSEAAQSANGVAEVKDPVTTP